MKITTKENIKLLVMFYILFNVLMVAKGLDESTWLLSKPCKEKTTILAKVFPGYLVGCYFGEDNE